MLYIVSLFINKCKQINVVNADQHNFMSLNSSTVFRYIIFCIFEPWLNVLSFISLDKHEAEIEFYQSENNLTSKSLD